MEISNRISKNMENKVKKVYTGVYGIFLKNNSILMIKKGRGPYINLYDLPGGGIEFNEKIEDCLRREFKEETGAIVTDKKFFDINEYICEYEENKIVKHSHHIGIYYIVDLEIKKIKNEPDGEDSMGAEFVPLELINKSTVSPITYPVIIDFLKYKDINYEK